MNLFPTLHIILKAREVAIQILRANSTGAGVASGRQA